MTYSKQGYAASVKYKAEKIKRVPLDMQISFYDEIKAAADRAGESVNGYIKEAIRQRMEHDGLPAADPVQVPAAPLPAGNMAKWDPSAGVTSSCTSEEEKRVSEKSEKSKKG